MLYFMVGTKETPYLLNLSRSYMGRNVGCYQTKKGVEGVTMKIKYSSYKLIVIPLY